MQIPALVAANKQRWSSAHFKQSRWTLAENVAKRLCASKAKAIYLRLEQITSVPWWVVAIIHEREASQRWDRNIAQGDPFNRVSRHVPKGRGPFKSFSEAAIDALTECAPHAAKWKDWSAGGALSLLELYNGEGYENYHHMASPYLWAGTQHYVRGKYVSDGHFDATEVDQQLGCAIMLRAMMAEDESILSDDASFGKPQHGEEAEKLEANPEEYPEPSDEAEQHPVAPDTDDGDEPPVPEEPKGMLKSKISNTQIGVGAAGASVVASQLSDSLSDVTAKAIQAKDAIHSLGLTDILMNALHKPAFIIGIVIILAAAATIYWRWRDHGRGQK